MRYWKTKRDMVDGGASLKDLGIRLADYVLEWKEEGEDGFFGFSIVAKEGASIGEVRTWLPRSPHEPGEQEERGRGRGEEEGEESGDTREEEAIGDEGERKRTLVQRLGSTASPRSRGAGTTSACTERRTEMGG